MNWKQLFPANSPSARSNAAMGFDRNSNRTILFGGDTGAGGGGFYAAPAETWSWDNVDWTQESPAHVPTPNSNSSFLTGDMGWDGINDKLMMVLDQQSTGVGGTTKLRFFHWDAGDWTEVTFAFTFPGPTGSSTYGPNALSWNPDLNKLLLFVANTSGTIYEWDGTNWAATSDFPAITGSAGPPDRITAPAFSYSPRFFANVYYGGLDATVFGNFVYDTAFYDGTWTAKAYQPSGGPSKRGTGSRYSGYLACARETILYGNNNVVGTPNKSTFAFRDLGGGSFGWVDLGLSAAPDGAINGAMSETRARILYFGGLSSIGGTTYDTTWLLTCPSFVPQVIRRR